MIIARRNLLRGMFAAPAIIAIDRLMPVKVWNAPFPEIRIKLIRTPYDKFVWSEVPNGLVLPVNADGFQESVIAKAV